MSITDIKTKKVTHCLEIAKAKNSSLLLVQAKAKYNQCPSEYDCFAILEYCYNRKIKVNTYDINSDIKLKFKEESIIQTA